MKIIQSYWTKPLLSKQNNLKEIFFHYAYITYSCLKYSDHYNVELFTDNHGKTILHDILDLPYTKINVVLDDINNYPVEFWAIGKIYTYLLQDEPFLHVDYDSFIWKPFPDDLLTKDLITQDLEHELALNSEYYNSIENILINIPQSIQEYRKSHKKVNCINAGIIGGNDITFIKKYAQEVFDFVNSNINNEKLLEVDNIGYFNVIFEQYLFYCLAESKHKNISYLLPIQTDHNYNRGLNDYFDIPHNRHYLHALGGAKKDYRTRFQMIQRLWYEYPIYYNRLINYIKSNNPYQDEVSYKREY